MLLLRAFAKWNTGDDQQIIRWTYDDTMPRPYVPSRRRKTTTNPTAACVRRPRPATTWTAVLPVERCAHPTQVR